ncbi:hypothetical protein GAY31_19220 [Azospirillum brasilense]|nr:hypothetical protein [Azospirillum brasilense]
MTLSDCTVQHCIECKDVSEAAMSVRLGLVAAALLCVVTAASSVYGQCYGDAGRYGMEGWCVRTKYSEIGHLESASVSYYVSEMSHESGVNFHVGLIGEYKNFSVPVVALRNSGKSFLSGKTAVALAYIDQDTQVPAFSLDGVDARFLPDEKVEKIVSHLEQGRPLMIMAQTMYGKSRAVIKPQGFAQAMAEMRKLVDEQRADRMK